MRFAKTLIIFALTATVCVVVLVALGTAGYSVRDGRAVGESIGGGLLLVICAVVAHTVARFVAKDPATPLKVGIWTMLVVATMVAIGGSR